MRAETGGCVLQEREIFIKMQDELRNAADACDQIATRPLSGDNFIRLRKALKLVEGCCRQAAAYRMDTRWNEPGFKMNQAAKMARKWLHYPSVESKKLFYGLAAALRQVRLDIMILETAKTGKTGDIVVPTYIPAPVRSPGGLFLQP